MIRFCDKNVYTIYTYDLYRVEMLRFFLNEKDEFHRDVVLVLNADNSYYGIMTYPRIIMCENSEDRIMRESITISKNFFEEARAWFRTHPRELLPVLDKEGQVCGFCYNDAEEELADQMTLMNYLESMEELPCPFTEFQSNCKQICIIDCNELAYHCYCYFKRIGFPVQVTGEEWEWLGAQSEEIPVTRKEKFYIYAEGTQNVRWDWTFEEKPPSIVPCFGFIGAWVLEIRKKIHKMIMDILGQKGVTIFQCIAPEWKELDYFTDLEIKAAFNQLTIDKAVLGQITGKKKELLKEIMGKKEVECLYDKGLYLEEKGFRRLSYNEIVQEALDNAAGDGRIYIIGPCIVEGYGNFTENMLVTFLQERVKKENYMVVKMPLTRWTWHLWSKKEIERIPLRKKDIVLLVDRRDLFEETTDTKLDFLPLYNFPERETWILNDSVHLNKAGIKVLAEEIYQQMLKNEIESRNKTIKENIYIQKGEILRDSLQDKIRKYIDKVKKCSSFEKGSRIGCIVMNCNPFTYGHQYLIEYSASKVDMLYIFVVEEERSEFSFKLRKQMAEEGTAHLKNVCIVPSGEWILSYQTFPIYFGKTERQEEKVDAEIDLEIFARYIAPPLGITRRFVGEEPIDKITRQYNEQMKKIFGRFSIQVEEIPRKEVDGKPISASYVRNCIKEGALNEIVRYVPESTKKCIEMQLK